MAEANTWAASVYPLPLWWSLFAADPRLIQVKVFLAQEGAAGHDQAAQLLAQLHAYCNEEPNRRLLLEAEALEAMFHARLGCTDRTLEALTRAVQAAEKDGWVRLLVDLGPDMARLLTQLARRGVAPRYLEHVLSAFPSSHGAPEPLPQIPAARLIEPLLERELDVLHLLAQRYSNKEIATRLIIASSTVKRHRLNIYRKLEVSDRREAVSRAAERRLLPPRIDIGMSVARP